MTRCGRSIGSNCSDSFSSIMCWQEVWLLEIEGLGGDLSFWKTKKARTCLFGNPEYTKDDDTDGVGLRCFYLLWWLDLKPKALSLCNSNSLGFFSRGAPKQNEKSPQSMLSLFLRKPNRNPSKQAVWVALDYFPLLRGPPSRSYFTGSFL